MSGELRDIPTAVAAAVLGPAAVLCDRRAVESFLQSRFPTDRAPQLAELADRITWNTRQAACFFDCALSAPLFISPLLGYYGVLAVSRAVVLAVRGEARLAELHWGHGLALKVAPAAGRILEDAAVIVKRKGAFPSLRACCGPPIPDGTAYQLAGLVEAVLSVRGAPSADEAVPHFLALFGLSMLVRYHAQAWGKCAGGKDAARLERAVGTSVRRFPAAAVCLTGMAGVVRPESGKHEPGQ